MNEKELLATIILHDDLINTMCNMPNIFIAAKNKNILEIVKDLYNSGIRITTDAILQKDKTLQRIEINELYDSAFQKDLFSDKLNEQIQHWSFNKIQVIQEKVLQGYYKNYQEYMQAIESCNISMANSIKDTYNLKEIYSEYILKTEDDRLMTGLNTIDQIGGLPKPFLIIIGARPGGGKTSLMVQLWANDMKHKYPIGIISKEMHRIDITQKLMANRTGIDENLIDLKMYSKGGEVTIASFLDATKDYPVYINDNQYIDIESICRLAKKWKKQHGIKKLYIDYLQLISSVKSFQNERDRVTYITKKLQGLRKELEINIFALAQLNRDLSKGVEERRPRASDLKDSGQIEQSADLILLLHEAEVYSKTKSKLEIIIGKGRKMPKATMHCIYHKNISKIEEIDNSYK